MRVRAFLNGIEFGFRRYSCFLGALGLVFLATLCPAEAAPAPITGEIVMVLEKGIGHRGMVDLTLTATCQGGRLTEVWGNAEHYNTSVHEGVVREAKITADGIEMTLDVLINPDQYVWGGWASYTVTVSHASIPARPGTGEEGYYESPHDDLRTGIATGSLEGKFTGVYAGPKDRKVLAGRAAGIVLPLARKSPGFTAPAENEHPRLLFRKSDSSMLKARLKTPLGQALLAALMPSKDYVAQAMVYHLTGQKAAMDAAVAGAVPTLEATGMAGNEILKTLMWGKRVASIAQAYDLCYDGLAPGARERMEKYLRHYGKQHMYKPSNYCDPHSHMINKHGAPHVIGIHPGSGLASLALYGTKSARPKKPEWLKVPKVPNPPPPFMSKKQLTRLKAAAAQRIKQNAERKRIWEYECALWEESGGFDVELLRLRKHAQAHMATHIRKAIGEGGFKGTDASHIRYWYDLIGLYAIAHRRVLGRPVTGRPDIGHFVPRYIATHVRGGVNQCYGGGRYVPEIQRIAEAMALCPEEYRPVVLWYWLQALGVSPEEVGTAAGAGKIAERTAGKGGVATSGSTPALINTLVHFPIDPATGKLTMTPKNPVEVMPRVWETKTHGLYVFRNGWRDRNDFVAQILAKQADYRAWGLPDAADILICGLGHTWFQKGTLGSRVFRNMSNVVLLPEEPTNDNGNGRVTYFSFDPETGSGTVTINLDDVYVGQKIVEAKNKDGSPKIVASTGLPATRAIPADTGIRGMRAFAVDYSGKAGVPALIAIVDKITGGKKKEWLYHIPKGEHRRRDPKELTLAENGFTVASTEDDTSMKATFATPVALKIEHVTGTRDVGTAKHGRLVQGRLDAVAVTGADPKSGEFFVVCTVQKGKAPTVTVEGSGLDAKIMVGKQTVSFDGEKIVFGK